ncbi:MAG: hypothetical protein ACRDZN_09150, partial [Acidimicrobiales bacterium]
MRFRARSRTGLASLIPGKRRSTFRLGLLAGLVVALITAQSPEASARPATAGQASEPDPLTAGVVEPAVLETLADEGESRFVVEYTARADLAPAEEISDPTQRGEFVVEALQETAEESQEEALAVASDHGAPAESFWVRNAVVVEGDRDLVADLAELDGVSKIRLENSYQLVEPVPADDAIDVAVGDPEWGVAKIRADAVWNFGVTGAGVVVANVDTGVDFTHPALVDQYRGNLGGGTFDHNYN